MSYREIRIESEVSSGEPRDLSSHPCSHSSMVDIRHTFIPSVEYHAEMSTSYRVTRLIFLRSLAAIYFVAFLSVYVQWPGLYSCDGLEPVFSHLQRVEQTHGAKQAILELPTLAWMHEMEWIGTDVDVWMEILCLTGIALSFITLIIGTDWILSYALLWLLYSSIQAVGQNFLSFQWDILLIETGCISVLLCEIYPRITSISDELKRTSVAEQKERGSNRGFTFLRSFLPSTDFDASSLGMFLLRFLLFRLMFASGVVKILSQCPSWTKELSALEYHYATQCIPTPLAWFAHQLPPFVQQISVAGCLFIEIIGAILLLVPSSIPVFRFIRQLAGALQVFLQITILLTGNYTFFNYLTIALSIVVLEDRDWTCLASCIGCSSGVGSGGTEIETSKAALTASSASSATSTKSEVELSKLSKESKASEAQQSKTTLSAKKQPHWSVSLTKFLFCTAVKLGLLAGLGWTFLQFYAVSFGKSSKSSSSSSASKGGFSASDSLPDLSTVRWVDLPYAILPYLTLHTHGWTVRARYDASTVQSWMDQWLGLVLVYSFVLAIATVLWTVVCTIRGSFRGWASNRGFVLVVISLPFRLVKLSLYIGLATVLFHASLIPFTHSMSQRSLDVFPLPVQNFAMQSYQSTAFMHVTSSYGLFRSMTGMGLTSKAIYAGDELQLTQTSRPELVIYGTHIPEGQDVRDSDWKEIKFRYKPSPFGSSGAPIQVAPHQPRLDWQMWFAALGNQPPTWLAHLLAKLLEGQSETTQQAPVWDLLERNQSFTPNSPPKQLKMDKFFLDFTRLPGTDRGRLTSKEITTLKKQDGPLGIPKSWWRSVSPATPFLGAINSQTPSLQNFLAQQGWVNVCGKMRQKALRTKGKRQKDLLFEEAQGSSSTQQARRFPAHPRWWELSYYLAHIETSFPSPKMYGPFSKQMKSIVLYARKHLQGLSLREGTWQEWINSPIIRMAATSVLVIWLTQILLK